jgi:hypothetical protein
LLKPHRGDPAITILCVVTLFLMMQITGPPDWKEVFGRDRHLKGHEDQVAQ